MPWRACAAKAAVTSGGDTRACTTDREAIVLLKAADTETQVPTRPPKLHAPPPYCSGWGQPECVTGMLVRTHEECGSYCCGGPPGCGLPGSGRCFPGKGPVDMTADRIAIEQQGLR